MKCHLLHTYLQTNIGGSALIFVARFLELTFTLLQCFDLLWKYANWQQSNQQGIIANTQIPRSINVITLQGNWLNPAPFNTISEQEFHSLFCPLWSMPSMPDHTHWSHGYLMIQLILWSHGYLTISLYLKPLTRCFFVIIKWNEINICLESI